MKRIILAILVCCISFASVLAQESNIKIVVFNKDNKKIFEKENITEPDGAFEFSDFMSKEEYSTLKPGKYYYLLTKGKMQKVGCLEKKLSSMYFFMGRTPDGYSKVTVPRVIRKRSGVDIEKAKAYLEIDGKRTLLKDGMRIKNAFVKIRKRKLTIEGGIPYKKRASLWVGEKEMPLDDRRFKRFLEVFGSKKPFMLSTFDDEKEENLLLENKKGGSVLYVIDGVEYLENAPKSISTDSILSIQILKKGEAATAVYGEKGENGVILIVTKKEN